MRKMMKIASMLLTTVILLGVMTNVTFAFGENMCDPFNNDLFSVIKEIDFDENDYLPGTMETYDIVANDDYSMAKIVKEAYNENGEKVVTDVTGFLGIDEFDAKYNELVGNEVYNDGLIYFRENDEYGGYIAGYKDVNKNEVFTGMREQGADFGYNIGILRDSYGAMNFDTGLYENVTTTFSNVMSDKMSYSFDADFTDFNDDGCAIMQKDNKYYIVKIKKGIIPTVLYNGEKIKFDQIPVIENGRTLVPLRAIFEKIGATVEWNGDTKTVVATKGDVTVSLTIDNTTATKNGEAIALDVPAKIISGRTLVPVRFVSDCFGVDVQWDGNMQRVILTTK